MTDSTAAENSANRSNVDFHMVRDDMSGIPVYSLPEGYRMRPYRSGDDVIWTRLQQAAEPFFEIKQDLFERQYMAQADALPGRMLFVETLDGDAVASISAWWETGPENPHDRGRIHWVVVHPNHQRRGLTKPMMTWAMQRLAQDHNAAMLGTSSGRIWAVKVYLDFGFHPDPTEIAEKPEVIMGWRDVQNRLQHPLLAQWLNGG